MIDFGNAKYYKSNPNPNVSFLERWNSYGIHCLDAISADGLWLEFGVATGATSELIIKKLPNEHDVLYGFDWFKGIPEAWAGHPAGSMFGQLEFGIPPNIDRLEIINGLFEDTVPEFVKSDFKVAFMHIDCDLYSSTKTILDNMKSKIVNGTVIMFDEFYGYGDFHLHEYKAWNEFIDETGIEYEWIAHTDVQACCIIKDIK